MALTMRNPEAAKVALISAYGSSGGSGGRVDGGGGGGVDALAEVVGAVVAVVAAVVVAVPAAGAGWCGPVGMFVPAVAGDVGSGRGDCSGSGSGSVGGDGAVIRLGMRCSMARCSANAALRSCWERCSRRSWNNRMYSTHPPQHRLGTDGSTSMNNENNGAEMSNAGGIMTQLLLHSAQNNPPQRRQ